MAPPASPQRAGSRLRRSAPFACAAVLVGATVFLAAQGCGPSPLARAYDPFVAAASPLLESEAQFWERLLERMRDSEDAGGVARYRRFLTEQAVPHYADLERSLAALRPGHERLDAAREQMLAFTRARRDFVALEVKRTDLRTDLDGIGRVQAAQEARDDARQTYGESVQDDVPDPRLADLTALDAVVTGLVDRAAAGEIEAAGAVDEVDRVHLPRLREIRDGRFDDTPSGRLFRRCVVATEEYHLALRDQIPSIVDAVQAARRSETSLREADAYQQAFRTLLTEAKRDR